MQSMPLEEIASLRVVLLDETSSTPDEGHCTATSSAMAKVRFPISRLNPMNRNSNVLHDSEGDMIGSII